MLTSRKLLHEKAIAIESDIRGLLRKFGLKVGVIGTIVFDDRIRSLADDIAELLEFMEPSLSTQQKLRNIHGTP
ncbi:putative transposase protein [Brucella thiophenivorans]|uniref:Putative transposase protein n=1 Tax=Brucella thiophenivorans TaxID=571255 RepID=A0A256FBT1_9HYPH|nr:putative transposase protein [Brucella thiophenivorans]